MRLSHHLIPAAGLAVLLTVAPALSSAATIYTAITPMTTPSNTGGGNSDGTGVWFNPLNGYAEVRGSAFPSPLFADGKFFLLQDASFATPEAEIFTEGLFSRGNGVIYASSSNLNPARFAAGALIGPGVGYQSPGAGFPDLGPTFGNWAAGGRGFLGLTLRDASGASSSDVFYGFADITVKPDFTITLNAFAYNNVRGQAITAFSAPVPEPSTFAFLGLGLSALVSIAGLSSRRKALPRR